MQSLIKNFISPNTGRITRLPSFPKVAKTATLGFNSSIALSVPTGSQYCRGALCRQAYYPHWCDQPNGEYSALVDYPIFLPRAGHFAVESLLANPEREVMCHASSAASSTYPGWAGGPTTTLFSHAILGTDSETGPQPWIYVPNGGTLAALIVGVSIFTVDPALQITFQVWKGPGEVANSTQLILANAVMNTTGAFGTILFGGGAWVRPFSVNSNNGDFGFGLGLHIAVTTRNTLTYTSSAVNAGVINIAGGYGVASNFLPLGVTNEYEVTSLPWNSSRVIGVSLLLSNTTKALNKEGDLLAARLLPGSADLFNFTRADLNAVHPSEKLFTSLETGLYAFVPPADQIADFVDYAMFIGTWNMSITAKSVPVYDLSSNTPVCCYSMFDVDGGTQMSGTLNWCMEFRTMSTLWSLGVSTLTIEDLHRAQVVLANHLPFSSNTGHLTYIKALLAAAGVLFPQRQLAITAASKLADALSPARPQTRNLPKTNLDTTVKTKARTKTKPAKWPKKMGGMTRTKASASTVRKRAGGTRVRMPPAGFLPPRYR